MAPVVSAVELARLAFEESAKAPKKNARQWRGGRRPQFAPDEVRQPIRGVTFPDERCCQCRIMRGTKAHRKTFVYNRYDSVGDAITAAIRWRRKMERQLGPPARRRSVMEESNSISGAANVQWYERATRPGGTICYGYVARWWTKETGSEVRTFHAGTENTYTDEREQAAFRGACAWVRKREKVWEAAHGVPIARGVGRELNEDQR